jgi:PhnB protein
MFKMGNLTPYILSDDARSQAEFYKQTLDGEILSLMTHEQLMGAQHEFKDKVMHLSMVVAGGSSIFMSDSLDQGPGISLSISYKTESEASEAFSKLAIGGKVKYPIELQPFGLFYGELTDKYGITWLITTESVSK